MSDLLDFVLKTYEIEIVNYFNLLSYEKELTVSFFPESEKLADSCVSKNKNVLKYGNFKVSFIQDFSVDKKFMSDINYCEIDNMKFIKIITPFTKETSYDFIIGRSSEMKDIVKILKEREEKKNFSFNSSFPIIGFDFKDIEKETIKFLMNEDFREYCSSKHIKLKRGIILEGKPGCVSLNTSLRIKTKNSKLSKVYKIKNKFLQEPHEPIFIQSLYEGKIQYKEIEKVIFSGEKTVFELNTLHGKKIRCSSEHPFKVPSSEIRERGIKEKDNFVKLEDLIIGEEIYCKGFFNKLILDEITSIKKIGIEPTFDIVMKDSANFVANGIVVHNTGKTLTLQWLRNEAEKNDITYRQFKTIEDFSENIDEYYENEKKIFVFEDFDAALQERSETGKTPNQILGAVLNTLEGVEEINDVVSIFTTNNIDVFDKAFIRPGRIDKVFRYELPTSKEYIDFFNAYIPSEKEFFREMVNHIDFLSTDVSYAILKGICDDINISKFMNDSLTKKELFDIIKNKVDGANKNESVKNIGKYIL